ncbi:hypothetical protein ACHAXR_008767 [Thalassiosira sp. AJA248-18]
MGEVNENEDYISLKPSFIGGAEKARRNARKRMYQPRQKKSGATSNKRWDNRNGAISPYPKSMREYERFFGSLLSSSVTELKQSETDGNSHRKVMQQASSLLNVPSIPSPPYLQQKLASLEGSNDARTHHLIQRSSSILSNASSYSNTSSSSGTYDNARSYYMANAPLILEESRYTIVDSLLKTRTSYNKRGSGSFTLELLSIEEKYPKLATRQRECAPLILNFQIANDSTPKKQQSNNDKSSKWTRPGSVLLLHQRNEENASESSGVLACIVPNGNWKSSSSSSSMQLLSLMIFRRDDLDLSQLSMEDDAQNNNKTDQNPVFYATALTTLIGQVRQMEACLRMVKVSFMRKLLGQKNATHIRFGNSSSEEEEEEEEEEEVVGEVLNDDIGGTKLQRGYYVDEEENGSSSSAEEEEEDDNNLAGLLAKLSKLNLTQDRAAKKFLESPKESLILVQGPPGTGKSTFLVNVICRRLAGNPNARLLVTAPTNKAVTVLAERFLNVVNSGDDDDNDLSCKCNAVLVGVEDKLISPSSKNEAEYIAAESLSSSLRSIFVYTWIESLKNEYISLLGSLKCLHDSKWQTSTEPDDMSIDMLVARAEKLKIKISMSIPSEKSACSLARNIAQQLRATAAAKLWEDSNLKNENEDLQCSASTSQIEMAISSAEDLIETLNEMESPTQELLATARVIFCTLSTAGASIIKQTRRIDDLLIDEAAAATEPEICIPFHLRPQRLLAVGDPLQLPPTIMSRHAADMGLSTSMHERLMYQCGNEHFMLDHQYRMRPDISQFPCEQFYNGKIMNGKNVARETYTSNISLPTKSSYSFINIRGEEYQTHPSGSYANEAECTAVLKLVEKIAARKVSGWDSSDKLRIITFYAGQVTQLRRLLFKKGFGNVLVATVDSSQGCEADVVIISFVRSSSKKGVRHAAGFLADDRRINVALTRARHQLICVGDASGTLGTQGSKTLKNLVNDAKQRGCLI